MIIFFDIVPVLFFLLALLFMLIGGASAFMLKILLPVCIILIARSVFTNIKRINNGGSLLRIVNIGIDVIRTIVFYNLFHEFAHSARYGGVGSMIDFALVLIIAGFVFFIAEVYSALLVDGLKDLDGSVRNYIALNFAITIVFCVIAAWCHLSK